MSNMDRSATKELLFRRRSSAPLLVSVLAVLSLIFGLVDIYQAHAQEVKSKPPAIITLPTQPRATYRSTLLLPQTSLKPWEGQVEPAPVTSGPLAPVYGRIPTNLPVVFLGIDDGWLATPQIADWIKSHDLPITLFLTNDAIAKDYNFFKDLQSHGSTIENHSLHHSQFAKLTPKQQSDDICQTADTFGSVYGRRPTLFRPPYGSYNLDTTKAASKCGMKAIIMWHATVDGGQMHYQDNNTALMPGDIVLMHFRPDFTEDIQAFSQAAASQHLKVAKLEDWLP